MFWGPHPLTFKASKGCLIRMDGPVYLRVPLSMMKILFLTFSGWDMKELRFFGQMSFHCATNLVTHPFSDTKTHWAGSYESNRRIRGRKTAQWDDFCGTDYQTTAETGGRKRWIKRGSPDKRTTWNWPQVCKWGNFPCLWAWLFLTGRFFGHFWVSDRIERAH